ncbi:MAG TPA: DUF5666 domain-containing protein [Acidisarcina sp.]|nr:DUF5666 domain-containing protein [Acidisarcina sp.]
MSERRQQWVFQYPYTLLVLLAVLWTISAGRALSQATSRQLGTVKSIAADSISLTTDTAQDVVVHAAPDAKIVKIPAGSKDMKAAQPIEMKDVAVGDRLLVRGSLGADAHTFDATSIIVMKGEDIQQKRLREQEDWQKHGTGGLVNAVDPVANTITVSSGRAGDTKKTRILVSSSTVIRKYAPDSVKFEDAQSSTLAQIKPGDQLRVRGARSADGAVEAEEIVSGSFRNLAGIVLNIEPAGEVLTMKDSATQKLIEIKITADSQLRRLPPTAAQMLARRVSGKEAPAGSPASGPSAAGTAANGPHGPAGMPGQTPAHEAADLQQIMSRLPAMPVSELRSGDTVMIVATPGAAHGDGTVITLLAGVEAIVAATPKGSQAMTLSPWDLNSTSADAAQ